MEISLFGSWKGRQDIGLSPGTPRLEIIISVAKVKFRFSNKLSYSSERWLHFSRKWK